MIVGDNVLARKFGDFAFFEATLVAERPLTVLPKNCTNPLIVQSIRLPNSAYDPHVFVQNLTEDVIVPLAMAPQKTIEPSWSSICNDDSSVTSEALSVDISSEVSFPAFEISKKAPRNEFIHKMLPQYEVIHRAQVRTYLTSESQKLCVLEKGMTFHVCKEFLDFTITDVVEFWVRRFPSFPREPTLWDKTVDGKKLAKMKVETLRRVFRLDQEQAKSVRNAVRLAKRRVQGIFTLDSQVQCGWVALQKGKKMLARRIFGNCVPTLLLKNLFVSHEFSRECANVSSNHTFHKVLQEYRRNNKNCISVELLGGKKKKRSFFQNPSRTWYEETLASMLKQAGAKCKKVVWDGEFTQSRRHGSELGQVSMSKLKDNGRVKSFKVDRSGYTIPDMYAFVMFKSHTDLKNFLAIDFSSFSQKFGNVNCYPLRSMTAELDRTYANLSLAPLI